MIHCRFGFVEFASNEDLEKAMTDMQGSDLEGRSLVLDYMGAKSKRPSFGGNNQGFSPRGGKSSAGRSRRKGKHS